MIKSPNSVDKHLGERLRLRRTLVGMSQEKLADALGLTFQQVQKYEAGTNRISASRLHRMADVLGVPVAFFFEGVEAEEGDGQSGSAGGDDLATVLKDRGSFELLRAYSAISDQQIRRALIDIAKSVAGLSGENRTKGSEGTRTR